MEPLPTPTPTPLAIVDVTDIIASLGLDSTYVETLEDCRHKIVTSQKVHQLGKDDSDHAYKDVRLGMEDMVNAVIQVEKLMSLAKEELDGKAAPVAAPAPEPSKDQQPGSKKTWNLFRKLKKNKRESDGRSEIDVSPLEMALKRLENVHDELKFQKRQLEKKTKGRSPSTRLGSFRTLGELKLLVSESSNSAFGLQGRYEDSGNKLFDLVTDITVMESRLAKRKIAPKPKTDVEKATPVLKGMHNRLALCCDLIISFMLDVPFDIKAIDLVLIKMFCLVEVLHRHVEGKDPSKTLFDVANISPNTEVPLNDDGDDDSDDDPFKDEEVSGESVAIDNSTKGSVSKRSALNTVPSKGMLMHERFIAEVEHITKYLSKRKTIYNERREKIEKLPSLLSASERAIPNLGLKVGDLKNTQLVVDCMLRSREDPKGGLGLARICKGNESKPESSVGGGYSDVWCMKFPKSAEGVDSIKTSNRLVAVKTIILGGGDDESNALANLRMLREASRWSYVSADPRELRGGGQYLAKVLGIWEDFNNGRPGLVSLWGTCNLASLVREVSKEGLPLLSVTQRLNIAKKVAEGVEYLHTCTPNAIVHGDLKGANVIMVDGEPLLTDFGIAKCLDYVPGFTTRDESYTDIYRAPEIQYRKISLVRYPTKKSDVYAFGCLLFEILSGKAPYYGFSLETRTDWFHKNEDYTPLDADALKENQTPFLFDTTHSDLMKQCFRFHRSKRPSMKLVIAGLNIIIMKNSSQK